MKVHKLIEKLQRLNGDLDVWVSSDGINYEIADEVDVDSEDDVIILGKFEPNY